MNYTKIALCVFAFTNYTFIVCNEEEVKCDQENLPVMPCCEEETTKSRPRIRELRAEMETLLREIGEESPEVAIRKIKCINELLHRLKATTCKQALDNLKNMLDNNTVLNYNLQEELLQLLHALQANVGEVLNMEEMHKTGTKNDDTPCVDTIMKKIHKKICMQNEYIKDLEDMVANIIEASKSCKAYKNKLALMLEIAPNKIRSCKK